MAKKRCLVVGAGRIGSRKARALANAGAEVIVISPRASKEASRLARLGLISWRQKQYDRQDLDGLFLVVAATSEPQLNLAISRDARELGILICNTSFAADSDVIFPAVHHIDAVSVAVHTNGRDCRLSRKIRDALGLWLSESENESS